MKWTEDNSRCTELQTMCLKKALEQLVQEQLHAQQHTEESTSSWNPPVFAVGKKSETWRLVTNLSKVIQPMGPLQSGIPLPSLLHKGWPLIVTDLKDCFFTIPLQEKDREKFTLTVSIYNNSNDLMGAHQIQLD